MPVLALRWFSAPVVVAGLALASSAAQAQSFSGGYYSSKQPYFPQGNSYSAPPAGFHEIHTQSLDRHGSRGLSSFKYDDFAQQMLEEAERQNALTPLGRQLLPQVQALIDIMGKLPGGFGLKPGYGNLTQVGRDELFGIGVRNAQRNAALLRDINTQNLRIEFSSSGQPRANDSGWNFGLGLLSGNAQLTDNLDFDTKAGHVVIEEQPELLYAHKDKDAPGYARYQRWKGSELVDDLEDLSVDQPCSRRAARTLLERIFTPEFVDELDNEELNFTGRENPDKDVDGMVDAALKFYNLYIITPALAGQPGTPKGGWLFDRFMDDTIASTMAYLLDVEDFYESGPAVEGQTASYDLYEPLLEEMLASIKRRAEGGKVAAQYRFAHSETLVPLAALLKTPGSERGVPVDQLMTYENSPWRGDSVSPMAANIQWDAFENQTGQVVVRMLYNEKEIPFKDACQPIAEGSMFYRLEELKVCLPLGSVSDHSQARL